MLAKRLVMVLLTAAIGLLLMAVWDLRGRLLVDSSLFFIAILLTCTGVSGIITIFLYKFKKIQKASCVLFFLAAIFLIAFLVVVKAENQPPWLALGTAIGCAIGPVLSGALKI